MSDWFKYYRSSSDHHLRCRPFIWIYWIHCLESAAWKTHDVFWDKKEFCLEKGSFITSMQRDSVKNGLSQGQIRHARKVLAGCGMINVTTTNKGTLVEVSNWKAFQRKPDDATTNQLQADDKPTANEQQTNDKPTTTTEERKENKEGKRKRRITTDAPAYSDEFESFWKEYPKREDKADAWELYKHIEDKWRKEVLIDFAKLYANEFSGPRKKYAKKAKYMLRNQEWLTWMEENKPGMPDFTESFREQDDTEKARGCTDFSFYRAIIKASHPNLNPEMISKAWDLSIHYKTIIEDPDAANH